MGLTELQKLIDEEMEMYPLGPCIAIAYLSVLKECEHHCFNEGVEVKSLGGLHVIGTSLHESRRIDNQVISLICSSFGQQFVYMLLETTVISNLLLSSKGKSDKKKNLLFVVFVP